MNRVSNFTPLLAAAAIVGLSGGFDCAQGSNIVASNLTASAAQSLPVRNSNGFPLPIGSMGMLGAFPGMTEAQIAALFESGGAEAVLEAFVQVGDPFVVGQGSGEMGHFEVVAHESLTPSGAMSAVVGEAPFVVLADAAAVEDATELLVLSIDIGGFPEDPEVGLESYFAMHLEEAEPVVGSSDGNGFLAAQIPPLQPITFAAWLSAKFDFGTPAEDLLPGADPDRDGRSNLAEFAMGSHPARHDFVDSAALQMAADGATMELVFRHRANGVSLGLSVEVSDTLRGPWVDAGVALHVLGGSGLPAGILRFSTALQVAGKTESFVRLRYQLWE